MTTSRQFQKLKNSENYVDEKKRVNEYIKNRYATDEEFRERIKEKAKLYQRMKRSS
jgi:hypothetical protein